MAKAAFLLNSSHNAFSFSATMCSFITFAALPLTQQNERMLLSAEPGEATVRGGWREFLYLATRREEGLAQGPFGELLIRMEQLAQRSA